MKNNIHIFCNIPNYFNENDINQIKDNYKYYLFPKLKKIIECKSNINFIEMIKEYKYESKYDYILFIDGRINFNSKVKIELPTNRKPLVTTLLNIHNSLKINLLNMMNYNYNNQMYLCQFLCIHKSYISKFKDKIYQSELEIKRLYDKIKPIFNSESVILNYLYKNKTLFKLIPDINIKYKDYDFVTMTTFGRMGRFGNQTFQWLLLNQLSHIHNRIIKLPHHFHYHDKISIHLHKVFNMNINYLDTLDYLKPIYVYREKRFNYNHEIEQIEMKKNINYDFYGYFQSPLYFNKIKLQSILEFNNKYNYIIKKYNEYKENHKECNIISIHIRRGDLIQAKQYGPSINTSYLQRSINLMRKNIKNIVWLIFSDDITWCKNKLKLKEPIYYPNGKLEDDFILMSLCDHHIISNSTYSWWASYINQKNKIVICPKEWFYKDFLKPNEHDNDLIPKYWIRL